MKKDEKSTPKKKFNSWPYVILVLAITLSFSFGLLSEITLSNTAIFVAIIVILIFIAISILFDVIGLAVASCSIDPFTAMASRKIKGAKQALILVKNADKISSLCADVVGDVCGILAGAGGASIVTKIAMNATGFTPILISSLVSAIIAGLTIFGKAIFKRYAINHCTQITLRLAKFINIFTHKG